MLHTRLLSSFLNPQTEHVQQCNVITSEMQVAYTRIGEQGVALIHSRNYHDACYYWQPQCNLVPSRPHSYAHQAAIKIMAHMGPGCLRHCHWLPKTISRLQVLFSRKYREPTKMMVLLVEGIQKPEKWPLSTSMAIRRSVRPNSQAEDSHPRDPLAPKAQRPHILRLLYLFPRPKSRAPDLKAGPRLWVQGSASAPQPWMGYSRRQNGRAFLYKSTQEMDPQLLETAKQGYMVRNPLWPDSLSWTVRHPARSRPSGFNQEWLHTWKAKLPKTAVTLNCGSFLRVSLQ